MKLVYNKKVSDPFYYIQEGHRVGGVVKTITICKIGRHSELKKTHDDPLLYAKNVLEEYKNKPEYQNKDVKGKKLTISNENICKSTSLNIGYFYLQKIYHDLKIKDFISSITNNKKIQFNANDINRFLIFDRILNPKSKLATTKNLNNYYEKPSFTHQQCLRFMDLLVSNNDKYLEHLLLNSDNIVKRDTSICYYDCTNYYFEIEQEDNFVDDITGEVIPGIRQYGPSKEHKPNPIVEMGLFMDKQGIPITMGIFPGNLNEQKTVSELENKMIKTLKNKKIVYCADAGLDSASIRIMNSIGSKAFIVTQSIKKLSRELQDRIFEDNGFKFLSNDKPTSLSFIKSFNKELTENLGFYKDKVYKEIIVDSNVDLGLYIEKTSLNGKTRNVKSKDILKQKIIITYSRQIAEYQKHIREKQIERAKYLISKGVDDVRKGPNDVARFIKSKTKNEYELDVEKIDNEAKYDGFYAIATNLLEDNIKDILEINSQRYKIEDCFRVLKTNFDARPVYHRLDSRIECHFLICYTALLIYRLLEIKLKEKGYCFTINEIINSLSNMNLYFDSLKYHPTYQYGKILDSLNDTFNIDFNADYFKTQYIEKNFKKIS